MAGQMFGQTPTGDTVPLKCSGSGLLLTSDSSSFYTHSKSLYMDLGSSGVTGTLTVKDASAAATTAQFIFMTSLVNSGGTEGKIYWEFGTTTPSIGQSPYIFTLSQYPDPNIAFSKAKFRTDGTNIRLIVEIRSDEDVSGSTLA